MSLSSSGPTAPGSSPSLMAVTTPPGYKRVGTGLIGFLSDRVVGAIVGTERRCFPSEANPRLALPRVEGAARQRCGRPSARVRFHPAGVIGRAVRPRLLRHLKQSSRTLAPDDRIRRRLSDNSERLYKIRLSSPFGGDSRRAPNTNPLLSAGS